MIRARLSLICCCINLTCFLLEAYNHRPIWMAFNLVILALNWSSYKFLKANSAT